MKRMDYVMILLQRLRKITRDLSIAGTTNECQIGYLRSTNRALYQLCSPLIHSAYHH